MTVDLFWYPARPDAGTLPIPSAILSLDWDSEPWQERRLGEQYDNPRDYNFGTTLDEPPTAHYCGTPEDYLLGCVLHPDADPVPLRADGLPLCCGPIPVPVPPPPPPPPPAGSTCPLAQEHPVEVVFNGVTGPVGTVHWLHVHSFALGHLYNVSFVPAANDMVFMELWLTEACPPPDFTLIGATSIANEGFLRSCFVNNAPMLARFTSMVEGVAYTWRAWQFF